jgi:hypothetical protein
VKQSPASKNLSTEAEDIVGSCYRATASEDMTGLLCVCSRACGEFSAHSLPIVVTCLYTVIFSIRWFQIRGFIAIGIM